GTNGFGYFCRNKSDPRAQRVEALDPARGLNCNWNSETKMQNTHINTELPGPNARAMIARDAEVISPSYPRDYPFVMSHGRGSEVWDVDGNRFLDVAAGIA